MNRELIVNPSFYKRNGFKFNNFAKIKYEDGCLRIYGVINPKSNGDADLCGQCIEEIKEGIPTDVWTKEMLINFCDIWETWHLNDMRPYCEHQKQLGWDKLETQKVKLYHYTLKSDIFSKRREIENDVLNKVKKGECVCLDALQQYILNLDFNIITHLELSNEELKYYKPDKSSLSVNDFIEEKSLGFIYPNEHPDGILTKACPVCGYKYGTKWIKEEVPIDIIEWLFNLPQTKIEPAWI